MVSDLEDKHFSATSQGDEVVAAHIDVLIDALNDSGFKGYTLIAVGSFGRGEGVLVKDQAGQFVVINDYDFLVSVAGGFNWFERKRLRNIAKKLQQTFHVWHLDLIPISESELLSGKKTMMLYDTKYGGQVVYGESDLLDKIQIERDGQIPVSETLNLLINRLVTLYEAHPDTLSKMSYTYKARQLAKVWFALVDALLAERGEFKTRYSEKIKALELTEKNATVERLRQEVEFATAARTCKIDEDTLTAELLLSKWRGLRDLLRAEIYRLTAINCGQEIATMDELIELWRGGNKPSIINRLVSAVTLRPSKIRVEQEMYLALDRTSEEGFGEQAEKMIRTWYAAT